MDVDADDDDDTPVQVVGESDPSTITSAKTTAEIKQEESDEDEEFLIMADIGHDIDQETVLEHASKSEIHAINIDGTNPFIQIGPYTFQGQYNYVLGTNLFFSTTTTTDHRTDEASSGTTHGNDLHLIGLSDKKLNLSRVYIYPKKNDDPSNS